MNVIKRSDLFILDEIGYLPLESADASFLFEVVSTRYERRKPIILTSNESYGQWGEIFPDTILATALLDRLLHHATTINIRGESYRLRHRRQSGLSGADRLKGGGLTGQLRPPRECPILHRCICPLPNRR
jgi:DNA replication protein DnaC